MQESNDKVITIVSGGMDSVTLAHWVAFHGFNQKLISFNYGQRHKKELFCAAWVAKDLGVDHTIVDLTSATKLLGGSALTDKVDVPAGHYSQENMAITVVPNRNAIMLSIAYGAAVAFGAHRLFYGAHGGDHAIYPDCRPEFVDALDAALMLGNLGFAHPDLRIEGPFLQWTKADIVRWGLEHKVPYEHTWTCYSGGVKSCGICGTCCERLEAFDANSAVDPIEYLDRETWKKYVVEFNSKKNS